MKLCPNPDCPHRMKRGLPAEYLDRATDCSDCSCPLVDAGAYGTPTTERVVDEWHAARDDAAGATNPEGSTGRTNILTGVALIGLSVALFLASALAREGGGGGIVAIGPFVYGCIRLSRGADERRRSRTRPTGPYR